MSYLRELCRLNPLLVWILQCSSQVCYAKLAVYTLARISHARLDMQGHAATPTWCRKWWAALSGSTGFPHLPVRGRQALCTQRLKYRCNTYLITQA